jgi:hypothetical protein
VRRDSADDRCDHHPPTSLRRRWKGGTARNALGRSRGGFSTKINARINAESLPIGIEIAPGQTHDVTAYPALMDDVDGDPEQMLGDKGYDSEAVRQDIEQHGCAAAIPSLADTTSSSSEKERIVAAALEPAFGGCARSRDAHESAIPVAATALQADADARRVPAHFVKPQSIDFEAA